MSAVSEIETRVAELVDEFRQIGVSQMRDLPIYNPALDVEAVDFQPLGDHWIGVLITPWFMSAVLLPPGRTPFDAVVFGRKSEHPLPAGSFGFVDGGVERAGAYKSLSLHSPMGAFGNQEVARLEARTRLIGLLTPPPEPKESGAAPQNAATRSAVDSSRRAFIIGRGMKSGRDDSKRS